MKTRAIVPLAIVIFVWTMTTHGKFSNSGDELHYLTIAESVLFDGDFDLDNNYEGGKNWAGDAPSEAGQHAARTRHGQLWSVHDVGLPVLLLPIYAVATFVATHTPDSVLTAIRQPRGLLAYSIVSFALIALTAWAITMLMAALRRLSSPSAALAVGLGLALSPPVLGHAFLVFPETPAFAVTCLAVWLVSRRPTEVTLWSIGLIVAAVGMLPWLHRKFSFFSLGLLFVIAHQHLPWLRTQRRTVLAALAAIAILPQVFLHLRTIHAWGQIGGAQMAGGLPFALSGLETGGFGLLFDRERGLLGYAPIYLIVPAAWVLGWRAGRRWLIPILLLFLPMAAFAVWDAGFSPAARFLVPLTPLLALPVAGALDRPWVKRVAIVLAVFQAAITAVLWAYPRTLWPKGLGTNGALERIPVIGPLYERWLPSIFTGDSPRRGWVWIAVIAIVSAGIVWASRKAAADRA